MVFSNPERGNGSTTAKHITTWRLPKISQMHINVYFDMGTLAVLKAIKFHPGLFIVFLLVSFSMSYSSQHHYPAAFIFSWKQQTDTNLAFLSIKLQSERMEYLESLAVPERNSVLESWEPI